MEQGRSVTLNLKEKEQETNRRPKNDLEYMTCSAILYS